jgi:hypothetical protein
MRESARPECYAQASAVTTMLGLMRRFEEARKRDHEAVLRAIDNIPGKLIENPPADPAGVMRFLQEEAFKEKLGSEQRASLVDTLNLVGEETGAELPPMEIKDGVQIISRVRVLL